MRDDTPVLRGGTVTHWLDAPPQSLNETCWLPEEMLRKNWCSARPGVPEKGVIANFRDMPVDRSSNECRPSVHLAH